MTDERNRPNGVTLSTHQYVNERFAEHAREHNQDKEQRDLLRNEMDRRLEGMNEFREQLNKQSATFVTRELLDTLQQNLASDVRALNIWRSNMEGRMLMVAGIPTVIAVVAAVVAIIVAFR